MLVQNQLDGRLYEVPDSTYGYYAEPADYGYGDYGYGGYGYYGEPEYAEYVDPNLGLPFLAPLIPAVASIASKALPAVASLIGGGRPRAAPAAVGPAPAPVIVRPSAPVIDIEGIANRVVALLRQSPPMTPIVAPMVNRLFRRRRRA